MASEWRSTTGKGAGDMRLPTAKGSGRLRASMQNGVELDQEDALPVTFWYWQCRREREQPLDHGSGVSIYRSLRASGGLAGCPQK